MDEIGCGTMIKTDQHDENRMKICRYKNINQIISMLVK